MQLSKAEEQLMRPLWRRGPLFLRELLDELPEPRPAKTTISTLVKRMIDKGAVDYETFGNSRRYRARVSKQAYFGGKLRTLIDDFFDASPTAFASFFTEQADLSQGELRELQRIIDEKIDRP